MYFKCFCFKACITLEKWHIMKELRTTLIYGKESGRPGFDPWFGKIPWRRAWQPTPAFLPGESHGQRSLGGYSPWGHKSQTRQTDYHFPYSHAFKKGKKKNSVLLIFRFQLVRIILNCPMIFPTTSIYFLHLSFYGRLLSRALRWMNRKTWPLHMNNESTR